MRKLLALTTALGIVAVLGLAGPSAAQAPRQDSVTGSGGVGGPLSLAFFFRLDAHSDPGGQNPTGSVRIDPLAEEGFDGPVTCLNVRGNVATLNFVVASLAVVVTVTVIDSPTGDQIGLRGNIRSVTDCTPLPVPVGSPVETGDIVVVDAPPLPKSKDQCKNDQWRDFGVFKNQGACVSFVATKGKNPPGKSS